MPPLMAGAEAGLPPPDGVGTEDQFFVCVKEDAYGVRRKSPEAGGLAGTFIQKTNCILQEIPNVILDWESVTNVTKLQQSLIEYGKTAFINFDMSKLLIP